MTNYALVVGGDHTAADRGRRLADLMGIVLGSEVVYSAGLAVNAGDNGFLQIILSQENWKKLAKYFIAGMMFAGGEIAVGALNEIGSNFVEEFKENGSSLNEQEEIDALLNLIDLMRVPGTIPSAGFLLDESIVGIGERQSASPGRNIVAIGGVPTYETALVLAQEADAMRKQIVEAARQGATSQFPDVNGDNSPALRIGPNNSLRLNMTTETGVRLLVDSQEGIRPATDDDL